MRDWSGQPSQLDVHAVHEVRRAELLCSGVQMTGSGPLLPMKGEWLSRILCLSFHRALPLQREPC